MKPNDVELEKTLIQMLISNFEGTVKFIQAHKPAGTTPTPPAEYTNDYVKNITDRLMSSF